MIRKISTKSIAAREAAKLALPLRGFAFGAHKKILWICGAHEKTLRICGAHEKFLQRIEKILIGDILKALSGISETLQGIFWKPCTRSPKGLVKGEYEI